MKFLKLCLLPSSQWLSESTDLSVCSAAWPWKSSPALYFLFFLVNVEFGGLPQAQADGIHREALREGCLDVLAERQRIPGYVVWLIA